MEIKMAKATSNMRRLTTGDTFVDVDGRLVTVQGWPQWVDECKVQIPVLVEGRTRPSRRTYYAGERVKLV